jgi:hypothetical protein
MIGQMTDGPFLATGAGRRDWNAHRWLAQTSRQRSRAGGRREKWIALGMPAECEINDCGVLATGRCLDCNRAMCMTHQAKIYIRAPLMGHTEAVDRCWQCENKRLYALAAIIPREAPPDAHDPPDWQLRRGQAVDKLGRVEDSCERLLLALRYWTDDPFKYNPLANWSRHRGDGSVGEPSLTPIDPALFSASFPDYWASAELVNLAVREPPWDSVSVASWFARKALASGAKAPLVRGSASGLLGREIKGWRFDSTAWLVAVTGESRGYSSVIIDAHGRLRPPTARLHGRSLYRMAEILDLPDPSISMSP